ncbi:hypothetical protein CO731_00405 [Aminobacter sp. MSH1]|uniref:hypothetical protein n=1 Tax=Aminobacter sp. MSH1 TaxID=374606 RepID=UPI000D504876|nr:hypothetical protein [Aminobacter sp. MSH1]AWC20964.1 hypothetical protein CO731_00405 [Aminobacter sp. MSH1]
MGEWGPEKLIDIARSDVKLAVVLFVCFLFLLLAVILILLLIVTNSKMYRSFERKRSKKYVDEVTVGGLVSSESCVVFGSKVNRKRRIEGSTDRIFSRYTADVDGLDAYNSDLILSRVKMLENCRIVEHLDRMLRDIYCIDSRYFYNERHYAVDGYYEIEYFGGEYLIEKYQGSSIPKQILFKIGMDVFALQKAQGRDEGECDSVSWSFTEYALHLNRKTLFKARAYNEFSINKCRESNLVIESHLTEEMTVTLCNLSSAIIYLAAIKAVRKARVDRRFFRQKQLQATDSARRAATEKANAKMAAFRDTGASA